MAMPWCLVSFAQAGSPAADADPPRFFSFALLAIVAAIAAYTDFRWHRIPNRLTYPALVAGFLLAAIVGLVEGGWPGLGAGLRDAGLGFAIAFGPFYLLFIAGAIRGGGDVKLMAAFGAISAHWRVVLEAALYGFAIAAIMAIVIMIRKRIVMQTLRNIFNAAFMAASRVKPQFDEHSPRIPLAVGLSIGVVVAGIQHLLKVDLPWTL